MPSNLSGGSAGSQRHHSKGPSTTGEAPHLPPAVAEQPCHVGRWVQASDPSAQEPASPTAAAEELPHYVGSVTSINSRHGLSVANLLRKLNKCISSMQKTADMGEKNIAYRQKEMSAVADKIQPMWMQGKNWNPDLWQKLRQLSKRVMT